MAETASVALLPDTSFSRVLAVAAHPDDMEYGASAAVHRWTARGIEVCYLLLTGGEAGMQSPPSIVGRLRAREQADACAVVGVEKLTILDHPDGTLMPTLEVRRDIARQIRLFRPDVVIAGAWDIEVPWGLNQADHRAAGLATLDACRDADNTWVFPELAEQEGLAKWGPTWLLVHGSAEPTHGVPVTDADVAAAVASLSAHSGYLADLPDHLEPAAFLPEMLRAGGQALDVPYGVLFRAHRLR